MSLKRCFCFSTKKISFDWVLPLNAYPAISRYISSCRNFWLQKEETSSNRERYNLGFTEAFLEKIGDIDSLSLTGNNLSIAWSALEISSADELYHTIWNNIDGEETIDLHTLVKARPSYTLVLNSELMKVDKRRGAIDSNTCIIRIAEE